MVVDLSMLREERKGFYRLMAKGILPWA